MLPDGHLVMLLGDHLGTLLEADVQPRGVVLGGRGGPGGYGGGPPPNGHHAHGWNGY